MINSLSDISFLIIISCYSFLFLYLFIYIVMCGFQHNDKERKKINKQEELE